MSWHFLERWIEKANHHSTLIGKFWITFLIVCRMVIVASVGDRVYSDEQSEFKCNTLQPGCTNVCFNKFSPISHLRFWSFQILLVATPSVMFIVYSGHDQKKSKPTGKGKKTKKKALQALAKRQEKVQKGDSGGGAKVNWNSNANNNNACDNRNKRSSDRSPGKVSTRSTGRDNIDHGSGGRTGRGRGGNDADSGSVTQTPQVLATLINYKNSGGRSPIEASVVDDNKTGRKELNVPWQEMRWNSLMHVAENGTKNSNLSKNMWRKPKDRSRSKDRSSEERYKNALNADIVVWGPPSSDDDNRNGKFRKVNQGSMTEADMYQNGMITQDFDKEHELALLNAQSPPEYPGNGQAQWVQNDHDQKYQEELIRKYKNRNGGFPNFPQLEVVKTRTKKARFTRHFHLYLLSVFCRLALEVAFLFGQIMLYGFTVPALYKCEQWPCPNKVDCFISRPMEKTIFLYFMLIYTCICVLLNACEFKYLVWVYIFGRPKIMAKINSFEDRNNGHIIYDANGEPKYTTRFLDQDSEFDECDLAEIAEEEDFEALMQNGFGVQNGYRDNGLTRKQVYNRSIKLNSKLRARQEKMAEMRHHELDLILNAEEMQDDYDYDMGQNDPVEDMAQMEMAAAAVGGGSGGDDYNC